MHTVIIGAGEVGLNTARMLSHEGHNVVLVEKDEKLVEQATEELDALVDTFEMLGDWEERYRYLIELGRKLPPMPPILKSIRKQLKLRRRKKAAVLAGLLERRSAPSVACLAVAVRKLSNHQRGKRMRKKARSSRAHR